MGAILSCLCGYILNTHDLSLGSKPSPEEQSSDSQGTELDIKSSRDTEAKALSLDEAMAAKQNQGTQAGHANEPKTVTLGSGNRTWEQHNLPIEQPPKKERDPAAKIHQVQPSAGSANCVAVQNKNTSKNGQRPTRHEEKKNDLEKEQSLNSAANENLKVCTRQLEESQKKLKESEANCKSLQEALEALRESNKEQKEQLSQQDVMIQRAQEKVFSSKGQGQWTTVDDAGINNSFGSLERVIRDFSKSYARKSLEGRELVQQVQASATEPGNFLNDAGIDALSKQKASKVQTHLCLSAWLTSFVFENIITKPWFFLDAMDGDVFGLKLDLSNAPRGMDDFFSMMSGYYGENSAALLASRSDMSRLLYPPATKTEAAQMQPLRDQVSKAKSKKCEVLAEVFLAEAFSIIDDGAWAEVGNTKLFDIMSTAGNIAGTLHVQRSGLKIRWLKEVPAKFISQSELLEAHKVHHTLLDDDESCLDGKDIAMLTHPCVVAIGKSDGTDYSKERVLKKGVAYMGKI